MKPESSQCGINSSAIKVAFLVMSSILRIPAKDSPKRSLCVCAPHLQIYLELRVHNKFTWQTQRSKDGLFESTY